MRMKCTVTTRGRTVNLKSASWKVRVAEFWILGFSNIRIGPSYGFASLQQSYEGFFIKISVSSEFIIWVFDALLVTFGLSMSPIGRCCTALDSWKCTTAAHRGGCAASGSLLSPALSWCVSPSLTRPTSTRRWTPGPSLAGTAWTWSSPTATRGKPSGAHTAGLSMCRIVFWPCLQSEGSTDTDVDRPAAFQESNQL